MMNHRLPRQPQVQFIETGCQGRDPVPALAAVDSSELEPKVGVQVETAMTCRRQPQGQVLSSLNPAVPVRHGEEEQVRLLCAFGQSL